MKINPILDRLTRQPAGTRFMAGDLAFEVTTYFSIRATTPRGGDLDLTFDPWDDVDATMSIALDDVEFGDILETTDINEPEMRMFIDGLLPGLLALAQTLPESSDRPEEPEPDDEANERREALGRL